MDSIYIENRRAAGYYHGQSFPVPTPVHYGSKVNNFVPDVIGRTYCTRHKLPADKLNNTNQVKVFLYSGFDLTGVKVAVSFSSTSRNTVVPDSANWLTQTVVLSATNANIVTFTNLPVVALASGFSGYVLDVWVYVPSGSGFTALDVSGLNSNDPLKDNELFCAWTPGDAIAAWPSLGAFVVGRGCPAGVDYIPV